MLNFKVNDPLNKLCGSVDATAPIGNRPPFSKPETRTQGILSYALCAKTGTGEKDVVL